MPDRPSTRDLLFLTTHEPCTLCMSAITWAGFDNYYYFYSHEDSRDSFAIPHDLKILKEVFGLEPGGYRRTNEFWTAYAIADLIDAEPEPLRTQLHDNATVSAAATTRCQRSTRNPRATTTFRWHERDPGTAEHQGLAATNSTTTFASSRPLSSCRKCPPPSIVTCG